MDLVSADSSTPRPFSLFVISAMDYASGTPSQRKTGILRRAKEAIRMGGAAASYASKESRVGLVGSWKASLTLTCIRFSAASISICRA